MAPFGPASAARTTQRGRAAKTRRIWALFASITSQLPLCQKDSIRVYTLCEAAAAAVRQFYTFCGAGFVHFHALIE
jgi:hypothetical protein